MFKYNIFILLALVLTLTSCRPQLTSREYEEIVTTSPLPSRMGAQGMGIPAGQDKQEVQKVLDASVTRPPLSWETPPTWTEEKASGMRLATFRAQDKNGAIECSIISLSGQAGGIESNVIRWVRQINAAVPSDVQLKDFLSRQKALKTKGGFSATVIDLTELPREEPGARKTMKPVEEGQAPSMIAAIAELGNMTVFVKMTGSKKAVRHNREPFTSLCRSLKMN